MQAKVADEGGSVFFGFSGGGPSKPKVVVLFVRADPKPRNDLSFAQAYSAIMIAHPHDTNTVASFLEFKRRKIRGCLPELEFLACQSLGLWG